MLREDAMLREDESAAWLVGQLCTAAVALRSSMPLLYGLPEPNISE
jgi:hypothetical protein